MTNIAFWLVIALIAAGTYAAWARHRDRTAAEPAAHLDDLTAEHEDRAA